MSTQDARESWTTDLVETGMRIEESVILLYAEITGDYNPIHVDPAFAAATPLGGIIAHGTMSLNLIWQSLAATLGPAAAIGADLAIRFSHPVRIGDVLVAGGTRSAERDDQFEVWVRNGSGQPMIQGTLTLADAGRQALPDIQAGMASGSS